VDTGFYFEKSLVYQVVIKVKRFHIAYRIPYPPFVAHRDPVIQPEGYRVQENLDSSPTFQRTQVTFILSKRFTFVILAELAVMPP